MVLAICRALCVLGEGEEPLAQQLLAEHLLCAELCVGRDAAGGATRDWLSGAAPSSSRHRRETQQVQAPGTHRPKALWGRDCRHLM